MANIRSFIEVAKRTHHVILTGKTSNFMRQTVILPQMKIKYYGLTRLTFRQWVSHVKKC